jgi:hypothetical protein
MAGLDDDEVFRQAWWCQACEEKQAEVKKLRAEVSALKSGEQNRVQIATPPLSDEQAIAKELSAWQDARDEVTEITPSNAELLKLAEQHPAPQEWYDEAAKTREGKP